ncbi:Uncharacterised protein [Bordetella pertussis]|nr:Uncharacterised protein [Bordetella pertussis]
MHGSARVRKVITAMAAAASAPPTTSAASTGRRMPGCMLWHTSARNSAGSAKRMTCDSTG